MIKKMSSKIDSISSISRNLKENNKLDYSLETVWN